MAQKFILILWLIGVATAGFIFWRMLAQEGKPVNVPPKEGNIIFFGDSLVEGVGATPGNDLPSQLSRHIGLPVINAGRSGDTTSSALMRLERDVLSQKPRLVIILLGGNDAIQQVPPEELYNNLSNMVEKIQSKGAAILLLGVRGGLFGDPYRSQFERLAKEKKISYIPNVLNGILGNANLMSDPIHPNNKGYAKMAERIAQVLRDILR